MKKIIFVFLLIASLHAQTIHESKDYYLSNDEDFYETKLSGSDFYVLDYLESKILDTYICDYFDISYILDSLNNREQEILKDYTYVLVKNNKFEISEKNKKFIVNGYIRTEPENLIFIANSKTKWFNLTEKERTLIHEMAHALTYYKYGNKMEHDEYWALEVKIILNQMVNGNADKYIDSIIKPYGLKGDF